MCSKKRTGDGSWLIAGYREAVGLSLTGGLAKNVLMKVTVAAHRTKGRGLGPVATDLTEVRSGGIADVTLAGRMASRGGRC